MTKKPTKERVSLLRILERAVEAILADAADNYPATGDPLDLEAWVRHTTRYVIGAVRRKDVPGHAPFKKLTEDQKVELVLKKTGEKVTEEIEREQRQQRVEMLMGAESPGPAPKPPPESDPSQPRSQDQTAQTGHTEQPK